ncbi:cytochrome P450 [Bisporella sp. PMI_857]|nr:cytochrome P450 [Bisporella sp. PMI_857]
MAWTLSDLSWPKVAIGSLTSLVLYVFSVALYNLYFHPLAKYPGPRLAAWSHLWYAKHWMGGRWSFVLYDAHQKYGPIVRIAPNELTFSNIEAYYDIYGHATAKKKLFWKAPWYVVPDELPPMAAERDPVKHRAIKRDLDQAFSSKALTQQVPIMTPYINMFMDQVSKHGGKGIEIDEWFNWLTFDIISDLCLGESFGAVEQTKTQPQIRILTTIIYTATFFDIFNRMPYFAPLIPIVIPLKKLLREREEHINFTMERVRTRIAKGNNRQDFFGHLLDPKSREKPTEEFLRTNTTSLLIAGSETSATNMSTVTYFLLINPKMFEAVKKEVRDAFNSYDEITEHSTVNLELLHATIHEAMRIFTPLPVNLPRESPGELVDGNYIPEKVIVSAPHFVIARSPQYFAESHEFHPERWLKPEHPLYNPKFANDNLDASRPFLFGPRTCIGKNLAWLQMRIVLSKMLFLYEWEAVQTLGSDGEVDWLRDNEVRFLWAKPKFTVRYIPREGVTQC